MARECSVVDDVLPGNGADGCQYVIINPLDDSRAGNESIDEEKFKEIVWPKMIMAQPE